MWDERYGKPGFAYGTAPNAFLTSVAGRIPIGKVLSLGEGEGRNAVYLATYGHEVVAVDGSAVGLAKAERLAEERGVTITTVVSDLADFVVGPGQWDGIVSIFCHVPPPLRARVHAAVVRGLKPGGVFILEAYTPAQLEYGTGGPPTADLMVSVSELREELDGLELVHACELKRTVYEGRGHTGLSAVVQVVGVREIESQL
ncbi:MAG: class I SAM-dependent methyltransferase [Gemmatimonadales bacterium]|nr:class I SAM-dependent methyltransferase [Gemmatimonadales bacterium]